MKKVVKEGVKKGRSIDLVGCSTQHLPEHLEAQFKHGMNWQNLGVGKGHWNIDHRVPCAAFDLTDPKQQHICFHWTNLQPMWALDNMRKGAKLTQPQMSLCL